MRLSLLVDGVVGYMSKESTLARYNPGVPPVESSDLPLYMQSNLSSIASMVNSPIRNFPPLNKEPSKPRIGDIAFADGDSWDPGGGPGLYLYTESGWILVVADTGAGGGVPVGGIIMWSGSYVPDGWSLCNGVATPNGLPTPDLVNSFIKGAVIDDIGNTGGSTSSGGTAITQAQMPNHYHGQTGTFTSNSAGNHTHTTNTTGNHNHGVSSVVTGIVDRSAGGVSKIPAPEGLTSFATEGNHSHTTNDTGAHSHTTTISGITSSKGSGDQHIHPVEPVYYALAYILRWK